jgi:hypothetical protein
VKAQDGLGPLSAYLSRDQARLGRLLEQCRDRPVTDEHEAYDVFRAGLLRPTYLLGAPFSILFVPYVGLVA